MQAKIIVLPFNIKIEHPLAPKCGRFEDNILTEPVPSPHYKRLLDVAYMEK